MLEADADELSEVARADPDREAPAVDRPRAVIADAHAQKTDAVLVGIKAGERLAERFRNAVAAIRSHRHLVIDGLGARVEADRVVRGRHDDALDARLTCCLKRVVEADDVAFEDLLPAV